MFGAVGAPSMLDSVNIGEAHTLLVCVPDAIATRQAVAYARRRNPRLGVVARAQSERDADELRHMGVERVIVADRQLSNELVRHALRRFGISDREIRPIADLLTRPIGWAVPKHRFGSRRMSVSGQCDAAIDGDVVPAIGECCGDVGRTHLVPAIEAGLE